MLDSRLYTLAALICQTTFAIPIPQISSSSASTTGSSSISSSASTGIRTGANSYPVGYDPSALGDDGSWPWSDGGALPATTPKPVNLPDGYSLFVMTVNVTADGKETTSLQFLDNKELEAGQTSNPTGKCGISVNEKELQSTTDANCDPPTFSAVHRQSGPLRGDGSKGSAASFSMELYAGSDNAGGMGTKYNVDFGPSLWKNENVTCTGTKPPFSCSLKTLQYGLLFNITGSAGSSTE